MSRVTVEQRKIQSLTQHHQFTHALSERQVGILAKHMDNGRSDPVEITADGTIVWGYHWVQAAQRLGREHVEVVIRDDLVDANVIESGVAQAKTRRKMARAVGTYVLWRYSAGHDQPVLIGDNGCKRYMDVRQGYYAYIGSAFGAGGVRGRVRHHLDPHARIKWNIDFLKPYSEPVGLWYTFDAERRECPWARTVESLRGAIQPCCMFGANDCQSWQCPDTGRIIPKCYSHLFFFRTRPSFADFAERIHERISGHAPVHQLLSSELHLIAPEVRAKRGSMILT